MKIGFLRTLVAAVAGIAFLSCTADRIHEPAGGSLSIRFAVDQAGPEKDATAERPVRLPSSSAVDSIRIAVRDLRDRTLAFEAIGYAGSGEASIEMSLPAARDLIVLMSGDGAGPGGRGVLYFGRASGIQIERGRTTVATILLSGMASAAPVVEGEAGNPSYAVRWRRIPGASSYTLRESSAAGTRDTSTAGDTVCVFSPGVAQGSARLRPEDAGKRSFSSRGRSMRTAPARSYERTAASQAATVGTVAYRVRGETPLGPGVFGDSVSVDLSNWFDLPRVIAVTPADGATGVLDTSEMEIRFDRLMDQGIPLDTLVTLRILGSGEAIHVDPAWVYQSLILRHEARLPRGEWCRLRVSTKLRDAGGRPFDQDSTRVGLQAFISDFRVEEYDPLRVVSVTPADGATGIATTGGVARHDAAAGRSLDRHAGELHPLDAIGRRCHVPPRDRSGRHAVDAQPGPGAVLRYRVHGPPRDSRSGFGPAGAARSVPARIRAAAFRLDVPHGPATGRSGHRLDDAGR